MNHTLHNPPSATNHTIRNLYNAMDERDLKVYRDAALAMQDHLGDLKWSGDSIYAASDVINVPMTAEQLKLTVRLLRPLLSASYDPYEWAEDAEWDHKPVTMFDYLHAQLTQMLHHHENQPYLSIYRADRRVGGIDGDTDRRWYYWRLDLMRSESIDPDCEGSLQEYYYNLCDEYGLEYAGYQQFYRSYQAFAAGTEYACQLFHDDCPLFCDACERFHSIDPRTVTCGTGYCRAQGRRSEWAGHAMHCAPLRLSDHYYLVLEWGPGMHATEYGPATSDEWTPAKEVIY